MPYISIHITYLIYMDSMVIYMVYYIIKRIIELIYQKVKIYSNI